MSVRIMTRVTILVSYFLVIVLVSPYKSTVAARPGIKDDDPYTVLGVKRTATVDDVQRAYRQRARETHPDKNPSPDANDEFRRVATAFEILGNQVNKKRYDAQYDQEMKRRRRFHEQERQRKEMRRRQNESDRRERQRTKTDMTHRARATQARMAKIATMEDFATFMLDSSTNTYKTHCLMMFVSNKKAEKLGEEIFHFPYPFAGEVEEYYSHSNMLRVAKIRFNSQTDLTRLFDAKSNSNDPHIIFAKKGDALSNFHVFNTRRQTWLSLKKWVDSLYFIHATVANLHSLPVDLLIIRDGRVIHRETSLNHGYKQTYLSLHAGDRIIAFDERLDRFPGAMRNDEKIPIYKGALLLDTIVTTTSDNTYSINSSRCYDLSTQCRDWAAIPRGQNNGQCDLNPEFMHHICPHTCGVCSDRFTSDVFYLALQRPVHSFPAIFQSSVRAWRSLVHDIGNTSRLSGNTSTAFLALGLLVAFSIIMFKSTINVVATTREKSHSQPTEQRNKASNVDMISVLDQRLNIALDSIPILLLATVFASFTWMTETPPDEVPLWLLGIRSDLVGVSSFSDIFTLLLTAGLFSGAYIQSLLHCTKCGDMNAEKLNVFTFAFWTLLSAMLTLLAAVMNYNTLLLVQWRYLRRHHKNAAFLAVTIGGLAGVALVSLHRLSMHLQKDHQPPPERSPNSR